MQMHKALVLSTCAVTFVQVDNKCVKVVLVTARCTHAVGSKTNN